VTVTLFLPNERIGYIVVKVPCGDNVWSPEGEDSSDLSEITA